MRRVAPCGMDVRSALRRLSPRQRMARQRAPRMARSPFFARSRGRFLRSAAARASPFAYASARSGSSGASVAEARVAAAAAAAPRVRARAAGREAAAAAAAPRDGPAREPARGHQRLRQVEAGHGRRARGARAGPRPAAHAREQPHGRGHRGPARVHEERERLGLRYLLRSRFSLMQVAGQERMLERGSSRTSWQCAPSCSQVAPSVRRH